MVKKMPKISTAWVGCTNVTDDRLQTDGIAMASSEREREFTSAKNWLRFLFSVKAAALEQQLSKFYIQIQHTEASYIIFIQVIGLSQGHTHHVLVYSTFHRNPFKGVGAARGWILAIPRLWLLSLTTACTAIQAVVIDVSDLSTKHADEVVESRWCKT